MVKVHSYGKARHSCMKQFVAGITDFSSLWGLHYHFFVCKIVHQYWHIHTFYIIIIIIRYVHTLESHRLCEEALSHGYVVIKVAITVAVGPAGVGKTHLKFLLLEKKSPALCTSTPGAEAPILIQVRTVSAERFCKLGKKWQEVSADQMLPLIARYISSMAVEKEEVIPEELKEYLEQLQTTTASTTGQDVASATPSDGAFTSSLESTPPGAVDEASACSPAESEPASESEAATLKKMIDGVMGKLEKLVVEEGLSEEDAEKLFSREWIYYTDSGGQPQFHELLPLFVRDVSSVVIVSRLCDRLDQYPIDEYYKDGKLIGECESSQLTYENQMKCLIRSLLSRNSPHKLPKIIMVGTHLDKDNHNNEKGEVQRFFLMKKISHKWRDIGELLDIPYSELESIAMKYLRDPKECCRAVLVQWLDNPPPAYPTTW